MPAVAQNAVTITVSDGLKDSNFTTYVENDLTILQIIELIQALLPLVDALTKGKITKSNLSVSIPIPGGLKAAPDATADVEEKAALVFESLGNTQYNMNIPCWDEAHNATGSDAVDVADSDVVALVTLLEDGLTGYNFRAYNDETSDLLLPLTFQRGYELFVPRRK